MWYNGGMEVGGWITIGISSSAFIIATAALIWNIINAQRRVIVKVWEDITGETLFVTVVNKTRQKFQIGHVGFRCPSGNMFSVPSEPRMPWDESRDDATTRSLPLTLEDNARCVFWLSIKDIKKQRTLMQQKIVNIVVLDTYGRTHCGRIPRGIKEKLNN